MSNETKIIQRIQKLLALADEDGGGTEAERDNAMRRAQELMFKHDLDMASIEGTSDIKFVEGDMTFTQERDHWRGRLFYHIGEALGGKGFQTKYSRGHMRMVLVGQPDTVRFAEILTDWIIPQLTRECEIALAKAKQDIPGTHARTFRNAFYDTATDRIASRLEAQQNDVEASQGDTGMELVLVRNAALDAYMKENHNLRTTYSSRGNSWGGAAAGAAAGNRADLNPSNKVGRGGQNLLGA